MYFINLCHQSVLSIYPPILVRQQLGKDITAAMNNITIEELLDASFYIWSVLYQRKVGNQFFPELNVLLHFPGVH
jgi:hypothetical protein